MKTKVNSAAKVLVGLIKCYVMSKELNFNIFSINLMSDLWTDDKFPPTISELSEGIKELCLKGILTVTQTGYRLTRTVRRFSKANLITAAYLYDDIAVISDGNVETEIFFDNEADMNEYAIRRGCKFGEVDIYEAREFLLVTGLARISADGMYMTIE